MATVLFMTIALAEIHCAPHHSSVEVRHFVAPEYPPLARLARLEGDVRATVTIGVEGTVQLTQVTTAYPLLRPPVERAIREWTFKPPSETTTAEVTVEFRLDCITAVTADLPRLVKISSCPPVIDTNVSHQQQTGR